MTQIPAGWYPDPTAPPTHPPHLRYWDGGSWTEHAAAPPAPTAPMGYAAPGPTTPDGVPLAGWWWRVLAFVIDSFIVGIPGFVVAIPAAAGMQGRLQDAMDKLTSSDQPDILGFYDSYFDALRPVMAWGLVAAALGLVYFAVMLRWKGATLGQLATGLEVRLRETPGRLPWGAVVLRVLALNGVRVLPTILFVLAGWRAGVPLAVVVELYLVLDVLWPLWDKNRQALHDKVARTNVVKVR